MGSLRNFILVRVMMFFPFLWFLLTFVFILLRVIPGGNPIRTMNPQMPADQVAILTESYGLNDPLHEQYFNFLLDVARFDLGTSLDSKSTVIGEIVQPFGHTVTIAILASFIGIPLGIYLGAISGKNREKTKDNTIRLFTIGIYSIPIFLVGILLQVIFSYWIPILPPNGVVSGGNTGEFEPITYLWLIDTLIAGRIDLFWDYLKHLIMPSLALGMLIATSIARQVRTHMINQLEQDYIQFAKSRGISENKTTYEYATKNAVLPVINLMALQFALLLSGAILTETVFNIPGLGRYVFKAISLQDFPRVQGSIVIFAFVVSIVSLLSDIIYSLLDPRVKY